MDELKMGIDPTQIVDDYNVLLYIINSVVREINTVEVVKVQNVDEQSKTIVVSPIVQSANANGNPIPESPIYNIKYIQWQYGKNMIKSAPAVGDVGIIVVSKKDISSIESGLVGSFREFSLSDGIYIGGLYGFNAEPENVIEFTSDNGISITTTKNLTVNATKDVTINGVNVTVNASAKADVIAPQVNLGGSGGVPVAKDGDPVMAGSAVIGTIKASGTVVKTI